MTLLIYLYENTLTIKMPSQCFAFVNGAPSFYSISYISLQSRNFDYKEYNKYKNYTMNITMLLT